MRTREPESLADPRRLEISQRERGILSKEEVLGSEVSKTILSHELAIDFKKSIYACRAIRGSANAFVRQLMRETSRIPRYSRLLNLEIG